MKILTIEYNLLYNHDIFMYFLLLRMPHIKMFTTAES